MIDLSIPIPYIISLLMILAAFLCVYLLGHTDFASPADYVLHLMGWSSMAILLFIAAPWMFLTIYLKYAFAGIVLAVALRAGMKLHIRDKSAELLLWPLLRRVALTTVNCFLLIMLILGHSYADTPLNLEYPLHNGTYYVMQGGGNAWNNPFHASYSWLHYGYAVDIGKLNRIGARASSLIYSSDNKDYTIFNDTVYAPASGEIVRLLDTVTDNHPSVLRTNPDHGNHIVIKSGPYYIYLCHFERKTMKVKKGQFVEKGQPLGRVGNAGWTIEPHLHIHAWKNFKSEEVGEGTSVPLLFEGNFLTFNEVFIPRP